MPETQKTLHIKVVENLEKEVGIFMDFLHSQNFPQNRNTIFSTFPELKAELKNIHDDAATKQIVIRFIKEFRMAYASVITKAVFNIKKEIETKGDAALCILAEQMEYTWKKSHPGYILMPTVYPGCLFNGNTFFYSITDVRSGRSEYENVVAVSAHEISHFMLFDILAEKHELLGRELLYFIKKIIAPLLVYQDDFSGIFAKQIVANTNVIEIYFLVDGKIIRAFDYFNAKYLENRNAGRDFRVFLDDMIKTCRKIENDIRWKHLFWDKHGDEIERDPDLMLQFRKPIVV